MCLLSWVPALDCFWSSLERAHSLWWGGSGPLLICPSCSRNPSPRSALVPALLCLQSRCQGGVPGRSPRTRSRLCLAPFALKAPDSSTRASAQPSSVPTPRGKAPGAPSSVPGPSLIKALSASPSGCFRLPG